MKPTRKGNTKLVDTLLVAALVVMSGFVVARTVWSGRQAPLPGVFSAGYSFSEAKQASATTGKPMFVVASADWCGPCQVYKRGALADQSVQQAIESAFVPTYVNVDEQQQAAAELSVMSIPLTAVVQDGKVLARFEGPMGPNQLLELVSQYGAASASSHSQARAIPGATSEAASRASADES